MNELIVLHYGRWCSFTWKNYDLSNGSWLHQTDWNHDSQSGDVAAFVKKQQPCICSRHMLTWLEISVQFKCCVCVTGYRWVNTAQLSTLLTEPWHARQLESRESVWLLSSITHPPIEALESDPITTPPSKVAARMVVCWGRGGHVHIWLPEKLDNYTFMPLKKRSNKTTPSIGGDANAHDVVSLGARHSAVKASRAQSAIATKSSPIGLRASWRLLISSGRRNDIDSPQCWHRWRQNRRLASPFYFFTVKPKEGRRATRPSGDLRRTDAPQAQTDPVWRSRISTKLLPRGLISTTQRGMSSCFVSRVKWNEGVNTLLVRPSFSFHLFFWLGWKVKVTALFCGDVAQKFVWMNWFAGRCRDSFVVSLRRNAALEGHCERRQVPKPLKTGTTIAGVVFKASGTQVFKLLSFCSLISLLHYFLKQVNSVATCP